jgi:hypothetical protein
MDASNVTVQNGLPCGFVWAMRTLMISQFAMNRYYVVSQSIDATKDGMTFFTRKDLIWDKTNKILTTKF